MVVDVGGEKMREREDEIFNEWRIRADHGGGESVAAREMARALAGAEALTEAQNVELAALCDRVEAAERNERHMRNLHDWRTKERDSAVETARHCENEYAKHHLELTARVAELEKQRNEFRIEADCAMRDYDGLELTTAVQREALETIAAGRPNKSFDPWARDIAQAALAGVPVAEGKK